MKALCIFIGPMNLNICCFYCSRDIDEVSELSENDAPSDISLDPSDDEDLVETAQKITREISTMTDSCAQTVQEDAATETATAVDSEAARAVRANVLASELPPVSSEADETDPKFTVRPANVTVLEGEPMKLECEVIGTDLIGKTRFMQYILLLNGSWVNGMQFVA